MSRSGFLRVDSADHLSAVVKSLLGLEGALDELKGTWLPVTPWQMTLVCLLTQTLGAVEKQDFRNLLSMIYLRYLYDRFYSCGS